MSASPASTARSDLAARTPGELQAELGRLCGQPVLLMLTHNRSTMLSFRRRGELIELRAQRVFLEAPAEVVQALADWLQGRPRRDDLVQDFINARTAEMPPDPARPAASRPRRRGRVHDLEDMHQQLNQTYFDGRSRAAVVWGRRPATRGARQFRLGWYDPTRNLITLSRRLDQPDIPRYMLEYVLFHEMLHEILGIGRRADGRRDIHGRAFKLMEQTFPDYARAREFERKKWGGPPLPANEADEANDEFLF